MNSTILCVAIFACLVCYQIQEISCAVRTTSGEFCVFPFYYKDRWYESCTTMDYGNTLWCATSSNFDRDNKWGECDTTLGSNCVVNTTSGESCAFPFYYKSKRYQSCITVDNGNSLWCATTRNYDKDRKWGNCNINEVPRCLNTSASKNKTAEIDCAVKTTSGESCVFPFYYNEKSFQSCTAVDNENKLWCATSNNYDRDNKWGDCEITHRPDCRVYTTTGDLCVFPFYYKKKRYETCTTVDNRNTLWCATTQNYDQYNKWGNCTISDVARCLGAPCLNGGTCRKVRSTYKCSCVPGFQGYRCEIGENVLQRK